MASCSPELWWSCVKHIELLLASVTGPYYIAAVPSRRNFEGMSVVGVWDRP